MSPPKYIAIPLTPPLTPSSSINNSTHVDVVPHNDHDSRIIVLSNLIPTLDPSSLEHTIHHILSPSSPPSKIKGINTRSLPTTHSVPVVFFDSRDARTVFDAIAHRALDALSLGKVGAQMISVDQLLKDIGPSPFLESIDAFFHLRVQSPKQINIPMLQSLLASFGDLRTFTPQSQPEIAQDTETHVYHIDYFDSRHADHAILELHGKVLFGMSLAVDRASAADTHQADDELQCRHEDKLQTLKTVEFPSISTAASSVASADTFEKPELAAVDATRHAHARSLGDASSGPNPSALRGIGPPGSVSNLRVRFRSLGFGEGANEKLHWHPDAAGPDPPLLPASDESDDGLETKPTVLYASDVLLNPSSSGPTAVDVPPPDTQLDDADLSSSSASSTTSRLGTPADARTPDETCIYCPSRFVAASADGAQYQPPAGVLPSYAHYPNLSVSDPPPPDPGMVYYPSLSVTPAPAPPAMMASTAGGYEYLDAHYGGGVMHAHPHHPGHGSPPAPGWGGYDPSMIMSLPMGVGMGVNMNMGMVPLPMGVNMNMNMNMGVGGMNNMGMGMPPHAHGYYDGVGGRGYVGPYAHPPPPPQSRRQSQSPYQPAQYGVGVHLQPYQYHTPSSAAGSSGASSTGSAGGGGKVNGSCYARGTPPPGMGTETVGLGRASLRGREGFGVSERRRRDCECSRDGDVSSPAPAPPPPQASTVHYHDNEDGDGDMTPSTEAGNNNGTGTTTPTTPSAPSERNQLNVKRIEEGVDTRTTVMIKNIPNKMSDRDLMVFIERVCPRRIDFFYLRMDFQNGCNVGYAFVNFIHVQDLLRFAKARLGVKWNMFSSEKVLQMSYANYQGKEALVEKFKNSAIMDEREAWRPRIFYSAGPSQGLPEPFPPPTHMRRKERSFFNRGALFGPGGAAGGGGGGERMSASGRGMRVGNGTEGVLTMRTFSGVGSMTFKSWMGRTTRNGAGSGSGSGAAVELEADVF